MRQFNLLPFFAPYLRDLFLGEGAQAMHHSEPGKPEFGWVCIRQGANATKGTINRLDLTTKINHSIVVPGMPGFFAQAQTNRVYVTGATDALWVVDDRGDEPVFHRSNVEVEAGEVAMFNDGVVAGELGILAGTKTLNWPAPTGALYFFPFFGGKPRAVRIKDKVVCSNGIIIIRIVGKVVYFAYIDTPTLKIVELKLDTETGECEEVRVIKTFPEGGGMPDGMRPNPGLDQPTHGIVSMFNPTDTIVGEKLEFDLSTGETTTRWNAIGAARQTCNDFVMNWEGSGISMQDSPILIAGTSADEGMPVAYYPNQPHRGKIHIGPTHYRGPLRPQALVPDDYWKALIESVA